MLGKSSRRLLAYAVQRKWGVATRLLLSCVAADQPVHEAMAQVGTAACSQCRHCEHREKSSWRLMGRDSCA